VHIPAANVRLEGFTITRDVDTQDKWMASNNNQGLNVRGLGDTIYNCKIINNRNGVYVNDAKNVTVEKCEITGNRTGVQVCNNLDGLKIINNTITDNYTMGVLFNTPKIADNGTIKLNENTITGNWYGNIRSRFALTSTRIDATNNYFGTAMPTKGTLDTDPAYADQVPALYGGVAPAAPADVNGDTYTLVDIFPWYTDSVGGTKASLDTALWVDDSFTAADGEFFALPSGNIAQMGVNAFKTIKDGVAAAFAADKNMVNVLAGTYTTTAAIDLTKPVTIQGAGDDTVLTNAASTYFNLASAGITIKNLKFLDCLTDYSTLRAGTAANIANLTIDNCTFMNGKMAMNFYAETPGSNLAKSENIQIINSRFKNYTMKGIATEKFNNSAIENCTFENVGADASYNFGAAIDINLKYDAYTGVKIENNTFTGCGIGSLNGTAVTVKERGTGNDTSYAADPATLTDVSIKNNIFTGNKCDVYFGEPGKNSVGPTGTVFKENNLSAKVMNNTQTQQDASDNYWGSPAPAFSTLITGDVKVFPFYIDSARTTHSELDTALWVDDSFTAAPGDYIVLPGGSLGKMGTNAFTSLAAAVKAVTEEDTIINVLPGEYGIAADPTWNASGQPGWYLPIVKNGTILRGVDASGTPIAAKPGLATSLPLIYGTGFSVNGAWATQNLVTVFGNDVTISGLSFMPKSEPNKTIEIVGANATVKFCRFQPTNKVDVANVFDGRSYYDYRNYGGAVYINGDTLNGSVSNVSILNNYFSKSAVAMGNIRFTGGITIHGNTFDAPYVIYDYAAHANTVGYMVGNTSWGRPVTATCPVAVDDNEFINLPTTYNYAVRNRLNGLFTLTANYMEGDDLGRILFDYKYFETQVPGTSIDEGILLDTYRDNAKNIIAADIMINKASLTNANLNEIQTSAGALDKTFDAAVASYTVDLGYETAGTTISVIPASPLASVKIDGVTASSKYVALDKGGTQTLSIAVTAWDGATTKTYTVTVNREKDGNVSLASLIPSVGTLSPAFDGATTNYTLTLNKTTSQVNIAVAAAVATSKVTVGGVEVTGKTVTVANNASQTVVFKVTADNGATRDYTVVVKRGDYGTFKFSVKDNTNKVVAGVKIGVYYDAATISLVKSGTTAANGTLSITGLDPKTYYVKIISVPKGYKLPTLVLTLAAKDDTVTERNLVIEKSEEQGYVYSAWQLKSLGFSKGKLNRTFDPSVWKYALKLDEKTSSVTFKPVKAESSATMYINGRRVTSKTFTLKNGKSATVKIKVVSGKHNFTYTVVVTRDKSSNTNLKSLKASKGTLTPAFAKSKYEYTLKLTASQSSVSFSFTLEGPGSTYLLNLDNKYVKSKLVSLKKGETRTFKIIVKAQNGKARKEYKITISRALS
jgi:parallel beta-helix repeat protein